MGLTKISSNSTNKRITTKHRKEIEINRQRVEQASIASTHTIIRSTSTKMIAHKMILSAAILTVSNACADDSVVNGKLLFRLNAQANGKSHPCYKLSPHWSKGWQERQFTFRVNHNGSNDMLYNGKKNSDCVVPLTNAFVIENANKQMVRNKSRGFVPCQIVTDERTFCFMVKRDQMETIKSMSQKCVHVTAELATQKGFFGGKKTDFANDHTRWGRPAAEKFGGIILFRKGGLWQVRTYGRDQKSTGDYHLSRRDIKSMNMTYKKSSDNVVKLRLEFTRGGSHECDLQGQFGIPKLLKTTVEKISDVEVAYICK